MRSIAPALLNGAQRSARFPSSSCDGARKRNANSGTRRRDQAAMNLSIALIDGDALMRQLVAAAIEVAFPGSTVHAFGAGAEVPLPSPQYNWALFDTIIIGNFADDDLQQGALAFVRGLALNATRRPVIYLAGDEPGRSETPLTASLKLLATYKLPRESFAEADLIKSIVFARRDRGLVIPANARDVFRPVSEAPIVASPAAPAPDASNQTQRIKAAATTTVSVIDGSPGFRAVLAAFVRKQWPEANIEEIDPYSQTMRGELSAIGARGSVILLGAMGSDDEARTNLERLQSRLNCPPVVALIPRALADRRQALIDQGASAVLYKDALSQRTLAEALAAWLPATIDTVPPAGAAGGTKFGEFKLMLRGEAQKIELDGFRYLDTIAASPLSQVFYAERVSDRKRAVVKVGVEAPTHNAAAIRSFCERFPFFAGLNGRGVVRYLDVGICGPWPYVALEYLAAGDLRRRMRGPVAPGEAARIMYKLAAALSSVHSGDIAHLDLKPENIFFRDNGDLVLIDFNISTKFGEPAQSARAEAGAVIGSPDYMSPEQGRGENIDGRSDLYSAGVIFFEMLSGEKPYAAKNTAEVIFRHIHDEIPLLPKSVREFQPIIDRLMAKNRQERYANGAELAFALQPFVHTNAPPAA
jgi:eukaryotic-like serine/threonine-protein kinase